MRGASTIAVVTLALVVTACAVGVAEGRSPRPERSDGVDVDVQGHRGCRGLLPENTLPAFAEALRLGVTTLELDLQVTRDRVLVVYHDQHLDPARCIRDGGEPLEPVALEDLDFASLAEVDCGSLPHPRFPQQQPVPGARIPQFDQVLELAREAAYPVRLNVEIKLQKERHGIPRDEFAELVVRAIRQHRLLERVTVQSFDAAALVALRRLEPALQRSVLVRQRADYGRLVEETGADILSPDFRRLTREDVRRFQDRGVAVIPWTVNESADIRRALDWGVDGIISDYPDRVLDQLDRDGR
jgi:glycerophosphoryl diester phosphodiesterase